jgi:hypothetical protein
LRALFLFLLFAMSLVARPVFAREASRIAIVHELSADERAIGRLRAELSTLGFEVVDVTLAANEGATALDDAARRVNAFAAVHVVPSKGGVEVWIADGATGKTLSRERVIGPGEPFDDVAALQAAELLRARLAELGLAPKRAKTESSTQVEHPPPKPREDVSRLVLQIGPAIGLSPGGLGPTVHGLVGLRWRTWTTVGFDAFAVLPISAARVSAPEGSADVRPSLAGLSVAAWLLDPISPWQVTAAGGLALAHLSIAADPVPPFLGRSEQNTAAMPFVRLSAARVMGARFRLGLDMFAGVATPRPIIRFDGREVAHWGQPLFLSVLTLGVALD